MTTGLFQILAEVSQSLSTMNKPWALIGGLAISCYVEPRFTRDIDIAIAVDSDREAEDFLQTWRGRGYILDMFLEQDATGRLATVRTYQQGAQSDGIVVDLLFASSGIEKEIIENSQILEIVEGVSVPVATPGHLAALKLLAVDPNLRPADILDLHSLASVLTESDRAMTQQAIDLITRRNYNRGRDLKVFYDKYFG